MENKYVKNVYEALQDLEEIGAIDSRIEYLKVMQELQREIQLRIDNATLILLDKS